MKYKEFIVLMTRKRMTRLTPSQVKAHAISLGKMEDKEIATIGLHRLLSVVKHKKVKGEEDKRSKGWTKAIKKKLKRVIGVELFHVSVRDRHRYNARLDWTWTANKELEYCEWVEAMTGVKQLPSELYIIQHNSYSKAERKQSGYRVFTIEDVIRANDDAVNAYWSEYYYDKETDTLHYIGVEPQRDYDPTETKTIRITITSGGIPKSSYQR